jgi:hypothetical protein
MKIHFVTIAVDLQESPTQLQQAILTELRKVGEPLRWAIVSVDGDRAQVEAVVTTSSDFPISLIGITTV